MEEIFQAWIPRKRISTTTRAAALFFQVGRFYEFYEKQAEIALRLLGLKRIEARRGFQTRCGFPVNLQERYVGRLLRLGFTVHVVREEEDWLSGVKKRSVTEKWIGAPAEATGERPD